MPSRGTAKRMTKKKQARNLARYHARSTGEAWAYELGKMKTDVRKDKEE
jgi:hypothetical protein